MRRTLIVLVVLVVAGAVTGHVLGRRDRVEDVTGVVGSQLLPFFADPAVRAALAKHGYRITPEGTGSRRMADTDLGRYDLAFPASTPAAAEITARRPPTGDPVAVFRSPLAIASFSPVADLLQTAGLARRADGHRVVDLKALADANGRGLRWDQIPGNTTFPAKKAVLVATTRPDDSNSAALFAALLDHATGGDIDAVTKLFADQGAVDSTTGEPWESYRNRGKDFAPMVLVYEAQFLDSKPSGDRVLLYPSPTVMSEHTVVPFTAAGREVANLLAKDAELQRLAGRHGFRTSKPGTTAGITVELIPPPDPVKLRTLLSQVEERLL